MFRAVFFSFLLAAGLYADPKATVGAAAEGEEAFSNGEYSKAVELFTKAIEEDNTNPSFYGNRGSAYSYLGQLDEALKDYDSAIKKAVALSGDPSDKRLAYFYYNRAYAYERSGRIKEALADYQKTIELDPAYPDAHGNTAWILATYPDAMIRNATKALEYALIETKVSDPSAATLDTLAAAYAANGQFDEAISHQREAVSKAESAEDKREFAGRLGLYEQKQVYIEPAKIKPAKE